MLGAKWHYRQKSNPNANGFPDSRRAGKLFLALSSNFIGLLKICILLDDFSCCV
jgi:hypothetical protein